MADGEMMNHKTCDMKTEACQRMMCNKFASLEKMMNTRFDALDESMKSRTSDLDRRLAGLNELRNEVVKDRSLFVKQEVYDYSHRNLMDTVNNLNERLNLISNRLTAIETRAVTWTAAIALFFVALQIVMHYWGTK